MKIRIAFFELLLLLGVTMGMHVLEHESEHKNGAQHKQGKMYTAPYK